MEGQTRGAPISKLMGLSVTSCVDDEETSSSIPEQPNRPLSGSVRIRYRDWA